MDDAKYELREFRDADYPGVVAVRNAGSPDRPVSVEYLRHVDESFREVSQAYDLVAVERRTGAIVGTASLFRIAFMDDPFFQWISCDIAPDRTRQGIGAALYDALRTAAVRRGQRGLRVTVRAGATEALGFAARRGFVERRRVWRSSLDLAGADTSALPGLLQRLSGAGIVFTTLDAEGADDPEVVRRVHDLQRDSGKDVPVLGTHTGIPFEEFCRFFLEGPGALPRSWFLAKDGERYVGMTFASRESTLVGVLHQDYTGTRREYRGRGIAHALKLLLIRFAQQEGYARIDTSNDSLNQPMWTLNQRLGFRRSNERIQLQCDFSPAAVPPGNRQLH